MGSNNDRARLFTSRSPLTHDNGPIRKYLHIMGLKMKLMPAPPTMELLRKFRNRRRFLAGLSTSILVVAFGVSALTLSHQHLVQDSWQDWLEATLFLGVLLSNLAVFTYARRHRFPGIILWVRKFNRGFISRYLAQLWDASAEPWGQIITLTDAGVRSPRTRIRACVVFCVCWTLIALGTPHDLWLPSYFGGKHLIDNALTMLILIWGGCAACVASLLRRVVIPVQTETDLDKVESLLQRARLQRNFLWSGHLKLVQADSRDDALWKMAFMSISQQADAIIIDPGDNLSENVEWELHTLTQSPALSTKVILALPTGSPEAMKAFVDTAVERRVHGIVGLIPQERIYYYPTNMPRLNFKAGRKLVRRAEEMIGLAITCSAANPQNESKNPLP